VTDLHRPGAGRRLTPRFGRPGHTVKNPCYKRTCGARVTLRWRGPRQRPTQSVAPYRPIRHTAKLDIREDGSPVHRSGHLAGGTSGARWVWNGAAQAVSGHFHVPQNYPEVCLPGKGSDRLPEMTSELHAGACQAQAVAPLPGREDSFYPERAVAFSPADKRSHGRRVSEGLGDGGGPVIDAELGVKARRGCGRPKPMVSVASGFVA
jgi:hypothetical protein